MASRNGISFKKWDGFKKSLYSFLLGKEEILLPCFLSIILSNLLLLLPKGLFEEQRDPSQGHPGVHKRAGTEIGKGPRRGHWDGWGLLLVVNKWVDG